MTITTAKRPDGGARAALRLAPLALAAMLLPAECRADWKFIPAMDLTETYTSNANLQTDDLARSSWVSEAAPSFTLSEQSSRLKLNAVGEWHSYAYSQDDIPNARSSDRHYNATAEAQLVDNLLYADANASSQREAMSAFGPLNSSFSTLNTTQINTWSISPYLKHRFGDDANLIVRYARDSVDGNTTGFGNSMASTRTVDLTSGTAFNAVGWNLNYNHQDLGSQFAGSSSSENSLAGLRWNLIRRFSLTTSIGYDKYDYPALNDRTQGRSWTGGFIWDPSTHTHVQASFGHRYFGKTGSLDSSYRTPHTIWTLGYTDDVTTTRSQFMLPAAVDTAAMLDRLFAADYPDPVQRQQAIQAYMAATGLPATLTDSVNYLSNRYIRDRHLQGALTLRGGHSDLVLTVFRDERNALSLQQSDSVLLGSGLDTLDDNIRQRGITASFDYRLSTRTTALANLALNHVQSLSTNLANSNRMASVGLQRRFDAKTRGTLELRHSNGRPGTYENESFHENAIAATLSVLY
ncbi:MAG TPA: TIGR03016 family PEP-CTERM system-associated outer membrane protein [Telluria sp.]